MKKTILALPILALLPLSYGQIQILDSGALSNQVNFNGTYTQGFDIPVAPNPAPSTPWVNNTTLIGWYAANTTIKDYGTRLLSLGADGGAGDRALGATATAGGNSYFGLRLQNLSSVHLTGVNIEFDGEQWYRRQQLSGPQTTSQLTFSYRITSTPQTQLYFDDDNTTWTYVPALTFVSPNAAINTNQIFLDGNAPENSVRDIQALITGFDLAPGQELFLRWGSQDVPGGVIAHGLGIDNLSVSFVAAIPEPATAAALFGLAALCLASLRRRSVR